VARDNWRYMIVIYRDTLVRDFGHDPEALRRNVEITVRHEVVHHLGASERRVAELGL
jgi:predicted Zn-dependent protease with MMP-like domain